MNFLFHGVSIAMKTLREASPQTDKAIRMSKTLLKPDPFVKPSGK